MIKVVPSLSSQGWVTSTPRILEKVISYYITTDGAQSLVFKDRLINLPTTYFKNINDPDSMERALSLDLEEMLGRYFEDSDILTEVREVKPSEFAILLSISVIGADGVKADLHRVLEMSETGLRNVINISNYGTAKQTLNSLVG